MVKNTGLSKAKGAKKDEFYTAYEDIQVEINHYEDKFKGKTVLCNCDDPFFLGQFTDVAGAFIII